VREFRGKLGILPVFFKKRGKAAFCYSLLYLRGFGAFPIKKAPVFAGALVTAGVVCQTLTTFAA
jgi:hypothetical protein